jgi:L-2-hydroxycarboxylate dehydrogenase (NAD+)
MMVGMLAGVLNGAAFGSAVLDFNADFESPTNTGQTFLAMRPDLFRDLADFQAEMDQRIRELRESRPVPGQDAVRIPGERAVEREQAMRAQGIPVSDAVLASLRSLAADHGLDSLLEQKP